MIINSKKSKIIISKMFTEKGFSLVELIIYVALFGVILALAYNFYFLSDNVWTRSSAEARVLQDARLTIMNMEKEIRQAHVPDIATDAVVKNSGSHIIIFSDINNDGTLEKIEYYISSNNLYRKLSEASNETFPFEYSNPAVKDEVVIELVLNNDLFEVQLIEPNDPRREVTINIEIDDSKSSLDKPLKLNATVVSRNRSTTY